MTEHREPILAAPGMQLSVTFAYSEDIIERPNAEHEQPHFTTTRGKIMDTAWVVLLVAHSPIWDIV